MNRSTAALIIAILVHLLLIALFVILGLLAPEPEPTHPEKEREHRIKVSLKEAPEVAKEALVKNRVQKSPVAPPMPKGKQLETLSSTPYTPAPRPMKRQIPSPLAKAPEPAKKPVEKLPEPSRQIKVPDSAGRRTLSLPKPAEKTPPERSGKLYDILSREIVSAKPEEEAPSKERESRINRNIREAYGDSFGELTEGQQKFILDNQEIMRRITQQVLNRVAAANIPDNFRVNAYDLIEFDLYPNGDISDIRFIKRSGFYMLDDTTVETIQYAYGRYPKPSEKTLIRYKVGYYLQGY